jgi:hypothetical protein
MRLYNKIIAMTAATTLLTGCVSVTDPGNYRPQTETLSQDYYACDSGSTGTAASTRWNQYGGSSYVGPHINSDLLLRCMEAHNYRLRRATTGEWVAGVVFLPLTVSLVILTAGMYPGDSVRIGGGSADPDYAGDVATAPRSNPTEEGQSAATAPPVAASSDQRSAAAPVVPASTNQPAAQTPLTSVADSTSRVTNANDASAPSVESQPVFAPNKIVNPNAPTNQPPPFE